MTADLKETPWKPPRRPRAKSDESSASTAPLPTGKPVLVPETETQPEEEPVRQTSPVATVLTDPRIDSERLMMAGVKEDLSPVFTVSEMAKFFFDRSNHWIRWLESMAERDEDNQPIPETKGVPFWFIDPKTKERRKVGLRRNDKAARIYSLGDVEEIAHALAQNGHISGTQLRQTLLLVQVSAEMRGLI